MHAHSAYLTVIILRRRFSIAQSHHRPVGIWMFWSNAHGQLSVESGPTASQSKQFCCPSLPWHHWLHVFPRDDGSPPDIMLSGILSDATGRIFWTKRHTHRDSCRWRLYNKIRNNEMAVSLSIQSLLHAIWKVGRIPHIEMSSKDQIFAPSFEPVALTTPRQYALQLCCRTEVTFQRREKCYNNGCSELIIQRPSPLLLVWFPKSLQRVSRLLISWRSSLRRADTWSFRNWCFSTLYWTV